MSNSPIARMTILRTAQVARTSISSQGDGSNIFPAADVGVPHKRQVPREGGWEKLKLYKTITNKPTY